MSSNRGAFTTFCRTTTAKGIPRIAKSESRWRKVFWVVFTAIAFGLAAYQIADIVQNYLAYPVVHTTEKVFKASPPRIQLPSITLCGETVGSRGFSDPSVSELINRTLHNLSSCTACGSEETRELRSDLLGSRVLHQSIPASLIDKWSNETGMVVVDCQLVQSTHGLGMAKYPCDQMINVKKHNVSEYLSCNEYSLDIDKSTENLIGIELTVFFDSGVTVEDNVTETNSRDYMPVVIPHGKGLEYLSVTDAVPVSLGFSTILSFTQTQYKRLSPPYGACSTDEQSLDRPSFNPYLYCLDNCTINLIKKKCRCIPVGELPLAPEEMDEGQGSPSFCEDLRIGLDAVLANKKCMKEVASSSPEDCHCRLPCEERRYSVKVTERKWPERYRQRELLQSLNNPHLNIPQGKYANLSDAELFEFVEKRFLRVSSVMDMENLRLFTSSVEHPATSLSEVFLSLGIVLYLFTGVTVFFFMEVIEFLILACLSLCSRSGKASGKGAISETNGT